MGIHIRPPVREDYPALEALAPRLLTGLAPWRDTGRWLESTRRALDTALLASDADRGFLVAADADDHVLGFISMVRNTNFSGEPQLYIEDIAVAPEAEGQGIARALLDAAEEQAHAAGVRFLALDVNSDNAHARAVYSHYGFAEESLRLVKPLTENDSSPSA